MPYSTRTQVVKFVATAAVAIGIVRGTALDLIRTNETRALTIAVQEATDVSTKLTPKILNPEKYQEMKEYTIRTQAAEILNVDQDQILLTNGINHAFEVGNHFTPPNPDNWIQARYGNRVVLYQTNGAKIEDVAKDSEILSAQLIYSGIPSNEWIQNVNDYIMAKIGLQLEAVITERDNGATSLIAKYNRPTGIQIRVEGDKEVYTDRVKISTSYVYRSIPTFSTVLKLNSEGKFFEDKSYDVTAPGQNQHYLSDRAGGKYFRPSVVIYSCKVDDLYGCSEIIGYQGVFYNQPTKVKKGYDYSTIATLVLGLDGDRIAAIDPNITNTFVDPNQFRRVVPKHLRTITRY
jgi:hypothetical protein